MAIDAAAEKVTSRADFKDFGLANQLVLLRGHGAGLLAAITAMVLLGMFLPLLGWSLLASSSFTGTGSRGAKSGHGCRGPPSID